MALKDFVSKGVRPEGGTVSAPAAEPPTTQAAASAPAQRSRPPAALLDASVEFTGTMRCRESIRIDGRCEGELFCDQSVVVGQPAKLRMSIEAESIAVAGEVKGNITATRKITLEPTAVVNGNLCTPGIVIQEGAKLEGRIVIGSDEATAKAAKPVAKEAKEQPRAEERPKPTETAAERSNKPAPPRPSAPPPTS